MSPKLKILLRIAIVITVIFFATKPYNLFCNISHKCQPFYFSYITPKIEGIFTTNVSFEIINYRRDLEFSTPITSFKTVSNRINVIKFNVKNTSNRKVKFRPELLIAPEQYREHITLYQCLCSGNHSLKPKEEIEMQMVFLINKSADDSENDAILTDEDGRNSLNIRYRIKNK